MLLLPDATFSTIFYDHNSHMVIFSIGILILEYLINGMNMYYHQILNFILIFISVITLYLLLDKADRYDGIKKWFFPLIFIPYFTRLIYTLYTQDMTSNSLLLIFSFLAIYFGIFRKNNKKNSLLMLIFLLLASLSFNFIFPLGVATVFLLKTSIDYFKKYIPISMLLFSISVYLIFILSTYLIFFYFANTENYTGTLPTSLLFWNHFIRSLSFAFLPLKVNIFIAIPIVIFALIVVIIPLFNKDINSKKWLWVSYAVIGGVVLSIAAISYGRASMETMVDNRHRLITTAAIPAFVVIFLNLCDRYKFRFYKPLIGIYFVLLFTVVSTNYLEYSRYFLHSEIRQRDGVECIKAYYEGRGDGDCRAIFPDNITVLFDLAKDLNLSFTRDMLK